MPNDKTKKKRKDLLNFCHIKDIFEHIVGHYGDGLEEFPKGALFDIREKKCDPGLGPEWCSIGLHYPNNRYRPHWDIRCPPDLRHILFDRLEEACKLACIATDSVLFNVKPPASEK